ncbi:MAG: TRAP transporter substrate-binding protein DctP [Deltaproteobacteria bacterium]|nr:TRAP transporter substrate-binding protein DctP [Deltaproteobacteria bacterium]
MKRLLIAVAVLMLASLSAWSQVKEIKLATIAPAGSSWDKITNRMNDELKAKSGGKLVFRIYPGGTQGDEKDVVRKMRIKQIHAGGFTGNGLGQIAPQVRVLELPFLYANADQVDYVISNMTQPMEGFLSKGNPPVVLLGWAEAGFVYIYSNKPIQKLSDLSGTKIWQWEGDPLASATFSTLGVAPVPLAITDVMTALSTNMIEAVYAPPLGALALQWASKVKYLTDLPIVNSMGALVMLRSEFDKLTSAEQKTLREVTAKYSREIVTETRKDNALALEQIKKLGVRIVSVDPKERELIEQTAKKVWADQVGKLYSADQLSAVQRLVAEAQAKGHSAAAQLH